MVFIGFSMFPPAQPPSTQHISFHTNTPSTPTVHTTTRPQPTPFIFYMPQVIKKHLRKLHRCFRGAENRGRTDTMLPSRDFKSLASAYSAIPAFIGLFLRFSVCAGCWFELAGAGITSPLHLPIPPFRHLCLSLV